MFRPSLVLRYNDVIMLYVFCGSNIAKGAEKAHGLINSLRAKKPDAAFIPIDGEHWNNSVIEEHLGGQGLFSNKYIVFLDRVSENQEAKEAIADFIPAMEESPNIFIVLEGKLNAELKKLFEKHAEKIVLREKSVGDELFKKKEFNVFALGDALASRDAFKAWNLYRQAVEKGLESEGILGALFWQMKSIKVASRAQNVAETGLSPFVFGNCKCLAKNFSEKELDQYISNLITLYHDGHRGIINIETGLEKLLLNCGKPKL
jgi:DNA polymerase III delta subunit